MNNSKRERRLLINRNITKRKSASLTNQIRVLSAEIKEVHIKTSTQGPRDHRKGVSAPSSKKHLKRNTTTYRRDLHSVQPGAITARSLETTREEGREWPKTPFVLQGKPPNERLRGSEMARLRNG
jgi:hypothetical protein